MHIESKTSGHWTDEQLIEHIYLLHIDNVGSIAEISDRREDNHLARCLECQARLSVMLASRQQIEAQAWGSEVDPAWLADQRRRIYARLTTPARWWQDRSIWRWASAASAVVALGAGLVVFQDSHPFRNAEKVSDAQLAQEVSSLSQDIEAPPAAPLKALFE